MPHGTVVFLGASQGESQVETEALGDLVPEFGWSLEVASDLDSLRKLSGLSSLVAVLFDANSLGLSWPHALRLVQQAAASALLIPCHRLSDRVDWPDLADAGAFHALALPLDRSEVRQSLGFISFARSRRAANVLSISPLERLSAAIECRCNNTPCRCSGSMHHVAESVA